jgi:hypothetical protein
VLGLERYAAFCIYSQDLYVSVDLVYVPGAGERTKRYECDGINAAQEESASL